MCLLRFLTSTIFAKVSEGSENDEPYLRFFYTQNTENVDNPDDLYRCGNHRL